MKEKKLSLEQRVSELETEVALLRDQNFSLQQRALGLEFERLEFQKQQHKDYIKLEYDKLNIKSSFSHDLGC